jgi:hypothetical protein
MSLNKQLRFRAAAREKVLHGAAALGEITRRARPPNAHRLRRRVSSRQESVVRGLVARLCHSDRILRPLTQFGTVRGQLVICNL